MTLMIWNDNLNTGIEVVDRQHHGLVDMLNEIGPRLARHSDRKLDDIQPLLARLFEYATVHFQTEEGLMASHGVHPDVLKHHQATHAGFVAKVSDMAGRYAGGAGVTGSELIAFLASWLVLHILGEDQTMARQLRARAAGLGADQAYIAGHGDNLDPDPAALGAAFTDLYTRLTAQNADLEDNREAIERYSHHLEQLVQERTAELERSRDAAQAASVAKSRFLGTMSHELRTPMNAIVGYASLLGTAELPASQKDQAGRIVSASKHLLDIINQVIEYARLDAGGEIVRTEATFDLRALVDAASQPAFAEARAKGLKAERIWPEGLPAWRRGDPENLAFILGQLVGNAAKFTERGAIRVTVTAAGPAPDSVRFTVEDTGIGIAPEDQKRLFNAFDQIDDRPNRNFEGLGLGLAMARRLAEGMAGTLGLASAPGKGSRFWLDLSLAVAAAPAGADSEAPAAAAPVPTDSATDSVPAASLKLLEKLLADSDTRVNTLYDKIAPRLRRTYGEGLEPLARAIADFDYERALAALRDLTGQTG